MQIHIHVYTLINTLHTLIHRERHTFYYLSLLNEFHFERPDSTFLIPYPKTLKWNRRRKQATDTKLKHPFMLTAYLWPLLVAFELPLILNKRQIIISCAVAFGLSDFGLHRINKSQVWWMVNELYCCCCNLCKCQARYLFNGRSHNGVCVWLCCFCLFKLMPSLDVYKRLIASKYQQRQKNQTNETTTFYTLINLFGQQAFNKAQFIYILCVDLLGYELLVTVRWHRMGDAWKRPKEWENESKWERVLAAFWHKWKFIVVCAFTIMHYVWLKRFIAIKRKYL